MFFAAVRRFARRVAVCASVLALHAVAAFASLPEATASWRLLDVGLRQAGIAAVALQTDGTRLAVGGERGVVVGAAAGPFASALRRGPVNDLAFLPGTLGAGALLVATQTGLYRVEPDGRSERLLTGQGESSRAVSRIATASTATAIATAGGAFASRDGRIWQPLASALPSGSAGALALRPAESDVEMWAIVAGSVWRSRLRPRATGFDPAPAVRETIPFTAGREGPVDLALDLAGVDTVIVYPSALAVRSAPEAGWEILRPNLPPGSSAVRIAAAAGRFWLATDRGLLEAETLAGPWRRTAGPPGTAATRAVAGDAHRVFAATARGLVASQRRLAPVLPGALSVVELPSEPSIREVHREALVYLTLEPAPIEALRRGVTRRGWLPVVSFRAGRDQSRHLSSDYDEAFLSGGLRRLRDRDEGRSDDLDLALTLSWDLGDVAYHPEAIDVSREARELLELRDDVLDEVTQLYYERRRVIFELVQRPDPWDAEGLRLRLRADELAAGIDAWTGGWFGARVLPLAP